MKKKIIVIIFIILAVTVVSIIGRNILNSRTQETQQTQMTQATKYWTCSMHPSVRVSDEEHRKGKTACPICNMPLIQAEEQKTEDRGQRTEKEDAYYGCGVKEEGHCPHCDEGKTDARCICGEHSYIIKGKGLARCPVCTKELKEISAEETSTQEISRIRLSKQQIELAGIKTEPVARRALLKVIRTVGTIAYDPGLTVAQEEYLTALETRSKVSQSPDPDVIKRADDIIEKSKTKLKLLGLSDEQITDLEESLSPDRSLILPQGKMWVYADIYEYELGWIKIGQESKITTQAYPGEEFIGKIISINPIIEPQTRTAKIRIEVDNPGLKLKPQMYVDVFIKVVYKDADGHEEVLTVPREAVLDTGVRKIVYVDTGDGIFLGKDINVGPESTSAVGSSEAKFYPIISGLNEDELIVTKGNFLIDSQSQLTTGMSVLWGGATEIKEKPETSGQQPEEIKTQHRH